MITAEQALIETKKLTEMKNRKNSIVAHLLFLIEKEIRENILCMNYGFTFVFPFTYNEEPVTNYDKQTVIDILKSNDYDVRKRHESIYISWEKGVK